MNKGNPDAPTPTLPLEGEGGERLRAGGGDGFHRMGKDTYYTPRSLIKARELRKNMTEAEIKIWKALRGKQMHGYRFRRQQPIGKYIVDFVCMEARLVIELDGGQHAVLNAQDAIRERFLTAQGYNIIRFWNNEVMENIDGVLQAIVSALPHPLSGNISKEHSA